MSAQVPTKIVLKSTTKMSLNDRFTSIQQHARPLPSVQHIRSNMVAQQQASAANRRLAQQLANRPGLNLGPAGLNQYPHPGGHGGGGHQGHGGGGHQGGGHHPGGPPMMGIGMDNMGGMTMPPPAPQRSLKQRLGRGNIKARLNLEAVGRGGGGGMAMRGRGGAPPGANFNTFSRGAAPRGAFRGGRGQAPNMQMTRGGRGMNPAFRGGPRGRGGRGMMRGNFNRFPESNAPFSGWRGRGDGGRGQRRGGRFQGNRGRGTVGAPPARGGRGGFRGQGQAQRSRGRGGGGRGRGRGGRGAGTGEDGVSRETLDNQLDEYMSKTKSYLDTELDSYMAEAQP